MKGPHSTQADDRRTALLGLALTRPAAASAPGSAPGSAAEPGAGPSDQDLAALIDGRLSGAERERVLALLDANPEAQAIWLTASAARQAQEGDRTGRRYLPIWAGLAAAAVLVLALLVRPLLQPDPFPARVDRGLATALALGWQVAGPQAPGYGFGAEGSADPTIASVRAGFDAARAGLQGRPKGPAAVDAGVSYHLGRWLALLEAATGAAAEPPAGFWTEQGRVAAELSDRFRIDGGDAELAQALGPILDRLTSPAADPGARWRQELTRDLVKVRGRLGL